VQTKLKEILLNPRPASTPSASQTTVPPAQAPDTSQAVSRPGKSDDPGHHQAEQAKSPTKRNQIDQKWVYPALLPNIQVNFTFYSVI